MKRDLYAKLDHRWGEIGFENLEREEQEALALFWLEAEVMNGGLHQYFLNSSGDLYPLAISALERLGAPISLHALRTAATKLGSVYPVERDKRIDVVEQFDTDIDPFEAETKALQDLPEHFFDMALVNIAISYSIQLMLRPQPDCGTIYLYRKPVDMRKAIYGLVAIVEARCHLILSVQACLCSVTTTVQ